MFLTKDDKRQEADREKNQQKDILKTGTFQFPVNPHNNELRNEKEQARVSRCSFVSDVSFSV